MRVKQTANPALHRTFGAAIAALFIVALVGCSPIGDVIQQQNEAAEVDQALGGQPGVSSVETEVEDRGFDGGIRGSTAVVMASSANPAQVRDVVRLWSSLPFGDSYGNNVLDIALGASYFSIEDGLRVSVAGIASSWATEATEEFPISTRVGHSLEEEFDANTFVGVKRLSPVEQLAIADRLRGLGTIHFSPGDTFESTDITGRADALSATAAAYENAFADIARQDPADEREFGIWADSERVRRVWFVLPTSMASENNFFSEDSAAGQMIRRIFRDTPTDAPDLEIGFSTPDLLIGVVSISGCAPTGAPFTGDNERLQSIYMATRGLPARDDCAE